MSGACPQTTNSSKSDACPQTTNSSKSGVEKESVDIKAYSVKDLSTILGAVDVLVVKAESAHEPVKKQLMNFRKLVEITASDSMEEYELIDAKTITRYFREFIVLCEFSNGHYDKQKPYPELLEECEKIKNALQEYCDYCEKKINSSST